MKRGCVNYLFGMAALVGVCLLLGAWYLNSALRHSDHVVPVAGAIEVSASVGQPTWAPLPSMSDPPTPQATANTWPPPNPGGPRPVCWDHPGQGLAPGATCPPKR